MTETTRIFVEGNHAASMADPDIEYEQYLTSEDEIVCPICSPAANLIKRKDEPLYPDGDGPPPRHVRCRCGEVR